MEAHLTEHFTLQELTTTKTGLPNECPLAMAANLVRLAERLEEIRTILGGCPIHINSGYRSEKVNDACGGVHTSAHLYGRAADFVPDGWDLKAAFRAIMDSNEAWDQLILEPTWIHLGIECMGENPRQDCLIAHKQEDGKMGYQKCT